LPRRAAPLTSPATALTRLALTKEGEEALQLLQQASIKFQETLRIKPNDYRALYPVLIHSSSCY
jgi:hypothetical protein